MFSSKLLQTSASLVSKKITSATTYRTFKSSPATLAPIIEIRSYHLKPGEIIDYQTKATATSDLRKSLVPLRLFTLPECGGELNVAQHIYYYAGGITDRAARRKASGSNKEWIKFVNDSRTHVAKQASSLYVESAKILQAAKIPGLVVESNSTAHDVDKIGIYEIRKYNLKLGYDSVPKFEEHYCSGIETKLATSAKGTSLVTVLVSDVGELNEIIEIWRHSGMDGMEESRINSRGATKWREAVKGIAEIGKSFSSGVVVPLSFSPWK